MQVEDMETEITGETVDLDRVIKHPMVHHNNIQAKIPEDNYEKLKQQETRHNWLQHEGTAQFVAKLEEIRQQKLAEAENLAKVGQADTAIRFLLQTCSIKETIEIIKNDNN